MKQATEYFTIVRRSIDTSGERIYEAVHPELPTCLGQGRTPDEARLDLAEALELALEHLEMNGLPIPKPVGWGVHRLDVALPRPQNRSSDSSVRMIAAPWQHEVGVALLPV